ncbi:MAG TPA: excinuclease ABC subunit UvrC [Chthoniobacterales bacterium]
MPTERTDFAVKLRDVPHKPGVYVMRDRLKKVIYVGKARDLRKRVGNYFMPSKKMTADPKTRALIDSIWDFEWHVVKSEAEAVLYEGRLIKEFRPKYNVSFRDDKRFLLVRVNLDEPYPRFGLTRLKKDDGARYFGPFAHSGALRTTLNAIRKRFGLRTCAPRVPDEGDYRHCSNDIIKNCSAPCIGRATQEDYRRRVDAACEFLEGQSTQMIEQVEAEMKAAAEKLDFEKAAQLRNLLDDLRTTRRPMTRYVHKALPSAIDPQSDLLALKDALGLERPPRIMECFDISNISATHIVASMVRFRAGVPDRANYRRFRIAGVRGQNDFASMAEVVRRRYARILREAATAAGEDAEFNQEGPYDAALRATENPKSKIQNPKFPGFPDLIIVDGGKGQLSSACTELQRLGLSAVPIIGLAKEFEEIYRPGQAMPIRLPAESGALKLLQRIRDEAHRFANGYHSLLLKRRISESRLDDIPGVSEARKKALLARFGSVARLKRATPEALAELPGISPRLAGEILAALAG